MLSSTPTLFRLACDSVDWAWGIQATFIGNVEGKETWSRLIAGEIQLSHTVALQGTAGEGGGGGSRQRFILFTMQVWGGVGLESRWEKGWVRVHRGGKGVSWRHDGVA